MGRGGEGWGGEGRGGEGRGGEGRGGGEGEGELLNTVELLLKDTPEIRTVCYVPLY